MPVARPPPNHVKQSLRRGQDSTQILSKTSQLQLETFAKNFSGQNWHSAPAVSLINRRRPFCESASQTQDIVMSVFHVTREIDEIRQPFLVAYLTAVQIRLIQRQ